MPLTAGQFSLSLEDRCNEAGLLLLDSVELGWRSRLAPEEALDLTVRWYQEYQSNAPMQATTLAQIAG